MEKRRKVREILESTPVVEGAGVRLRRVFGHGEAPLLDPFLLLDDFHSRDPEDYRKGFPWHPHRGIETITYVLHGDVEHGDSIGNSGRISSGDVQWMTAGSGIIHQEMPRGDGEGLLWGFQLWANLPASHKMMGPRYRDVKSADMPLVEREGGVKVRIIAGRLDGAEGPVRDIITDPEYLDVSQPPGSAFRHTAGRGRTAMVYVIGGAVRFGGDGEETVRPGSLALFGDGDGIEAVAAEGGSRFLLITGRPIGEPVAWYGPIVMNTEEELETAFREYSDGTFIKPRNGVSGVVGGQK